MERNLMKSTHSLFAVSAALFFPFGGMSVAYAQQTPVVDHHQHLLSPTAARLLNQYAAEAPKEPAVPGEIVELLRQRERFWNDSEGLAKIFTPDALLIEGALPMNGYLSSCEPGIFLPPQSFHCVISGEPR